MPYFDHNATTPLTPAGRTAWLRAAEESWQNPSSPYRAAARVRARLEQAREQVAEVIGCPAGRIVFNSGATEGANAVFAHWARTLPVGAGVAVNPTEHPCGLEAARAYFPAERRAWIEVDRAGVVRLEHLEALLHSGRMGAVSVMAANNETGVVQPWREIAALCRRHRVDYHCDAAQWAGKLPADGLGDVDWVTASAHKFGGPKGAGWLKIAAPADGFRAQAGGEQEHGHRGGTEDYPAIAASVAALAEAESAARSRAAGRARWRDRFLAQAGAALPGLRVAGAAAARLWNTASLILPHSANHRWVTKLDRRGFQVSTGSACATGRDGPSHVLAAMGVPADEARRVIRISAGWATTEKEWQALVTALVEVEAELRAAADDAPGR